MQCFYIGGGPKVIITICVVVVTLHTAFVIAVLRHIWRHLVASTAEGIAAKENMKADIKALHKMVEAEDTESQDWHKVAFEKNWQHRISCTSHAAPAARKPCEAT